MPISSIILTQIRNNEASLLSLFLSGSLLTPDTKLNCSDMKELVEALKYNTHITSLNLDFNAIGDEGAAILAENLSSIREIHLRENNIGSAGAQALAKNPYFVEMNLNSNMIGDLGIEAFADNKSLDKINVGNNWITNTGIATLAKNTTLTTFYFGCNRVGDEGINHLLKNNSLQKVYLAGNYVSMDMQTKLEKKLTENQILATRLAEEKNPVIKANLYATIKRKATVVPSLLEIGLFAVSSLIEQRKISRLVLNEKLPKEIIKRLSL